MSNGQDERASATRTWLSTLPALLILLLAIAQGTAEVVQARMLSVGEQTWPGYAGVRYDPPAPECDPAKIGAPADGAAPAAPAGDAALLDDLFAPPPAGEPAPAPADAPAPTDAPAPAPTDASAPAPADGAAPADGGAAPAGDADLLDDLLGGGPAAGAPNAAAIAAAKAKCEDEHTLYAQQQAMITSGLRTYRTVETTLSEITNGGRELFVAWLVFLIAICAATATATDGHIGLRNVHTVTDERVSHAVQLMANLLVTVSAIARYQTMTSAENANLNMGDPRLALVWAASFGVMGLINVLRIVSPPSHLTPGGSVTRAFLAVPLYCTMAFVGSAWFIGHDQYLAGVANALDKLTGQAGLYLQVGLYVWAGMMLKRTRVAHLLFDALRPLGLAPELLSAAVLLISAIPTAYSGASGIWVMAAGAIIYDEMRRAGAGHRLALATTSVSGSLGVVLSPCLLVVIVASLNQNVTTSELFGWGKWVFALTITLFTIMLVVTRKGQLKMAPLGEALPAVIGQARKLLPYALILFGTLTVFALVLDTWLTEHTASLLLLDAMLLLVVWDGAKAPAGEDGIGGRLSSSTHETTIHIGALLTLMALSIAFGATVERAELMNHFPTDLGSQWVVMGLFVGIMIVVGMLMDPYGAVILVSATLAQVAEKYGISPVHFWMTVLVGFELGYLSPPVALNALLAKSVIGDQEDDTPADAGFWRRHEDTLLPVSVMFTSLLIVAFGPLVWAGT